MQRRGLLTRILAAAAAVLAITLVGAVPAAAATTSSPGPWPKIFLGRDIPGIHCTDPDGVVVYDGRAWTIAPDIRGPLFAPTVVRLSDFENESVVPLEFVTTGYPILWRTDDGGPPADGTFEHISGRPVGYGSVPTDSAPRITCSYSQLGHFDFGRYKMTVSLAKMLGLPSSLIGRTLAFDGEGIVSFMTPKYLFPTRAIARAPKIPVPDLASYPALPLPTTTCTNSTTHKRLYKGAATTASALINGYHWAPVSFWLTGDRIVTPRWSDTTVTGSWHTTDGGTSRSGAVNKLEDYPPNGFYYQDGVYDVHCRYSGHDSGVMTATYPLVAELGLPLDLVDRTISLTTSYSVDAQTGTWLFPPTA
jgi:hypothetical protein